MVNFSMENDIERALLSTKLLMKEIYLVFGGSIVSHLTGNSYNKQCRKSETNYDILTVPVKEIH